MAQAPPMGPSEGPPAPPDWPPPYSVPGAPQYRAAPPRGPAPGLAYAGFWVRAVAYLIDGIILDVPILLVVFAIAGSSSGSITCSYTNVAAGQTLQCTGLGAAGATLGLIWLFLLLVAFVYFPAMWAWQGQTLGQKVFGLYVVDAHTGLRISASRALLRYLGIVIGTWALFIGLIWAAFDVRKQGWHDKMASTFVVKTI